MRYRVGTKFIPFLGDGHGEIVNIIGLKYAVKWADMRAVRYYDDNQMIEIIKVAKYRVKEPMTLDEDLFIM